MASDKDHWRLEEGDRTHPVHVRLCRRDGGTMYLDLDPDQAARLAAFLRARRSNGRGASVEMGIVARQGPHSVEWYSNSVTEGVIFEKPGRDTDRSAFVPIDCAGRLGYMIYSAILVRPKVAAPADSVRRRTDDNLRSVFG